MNQRMLLMLSLNTCALKAFASLTPGGGGVSHGHKCVSDTQASSLIHDIQSLYHCMHPALAEKVWLRRC